MKVKVKKAAARSLLAMKVITVSILDPSFRRVFGDSTSVEIEQSGDILDALAGLDAIYWKRPVKVKRGTAVISSVLQYCIDPTSGTPYDDVGIEARGPGGEWVNVVGNPLSTLPDGATVLVSPDAGC